jgi:branched-chain amino acid transport system permease protein
MSRSRLTPLYDATSRFAAVRIPLLVVGAVLTVVGSWLPWATFSGFAGKMTLAYPGGARAYNLILVTFAFVAWWYGRDSRPAGVAAAFGAFGVTLWTILGITKTGGGLVNVGYGAWIALVGTIVLVVAFASAPDDDEAPVLPDGPPAAGLTGVLAGVVLTFLLIIEGLRITDSNQFLAFVGMVAAAAVVLARLGVLGWYSRMGERYRPVMVVAGLLSAVVFPFTQGGNGYWVRVGVTIGVFAATAIGLNIVVGLAGLLDLGYVAFFGVGAYVAATYSGAATSNHKVHIPFLLVVFMGAALAAVFGVFIGAPTLRLRGDYLAIVTLGFGEIFRIAANNLDGTAGPKITNGPNGIPGIPNLEIGDYNFGKPHEVFGFQLDYFANYFFAELLLLVAVTLVFVRLNKSRVGRAWVAIREDETAAAAMGVNTIHLKLLAFAIGAFLAGAAGTLNAHIATQVSPDSYKFEDSILLLAAIVLGGMGTVGGALLGSTLIWVLPEKLRFFETYRILLFGAALVVMMRFRPEGIVANRQRQREFHDDDGSDAGATSAPPGGPVASV